MAGGQGASKRANIKRAKQKQAYKKALRARQKFEASLPRVSEVTESCTDDRGKY